MAVTILDQLADYARLRVEKAKEKISAEEMKEKALSLAAAFSVCGNRRGI